LCIYEDPNREHLDRFELKDRGLHGMAHFGLRITDVGSTVERSPGPTRGAGTSRTRQATRSRWRCGLGIGLRSNPCADAAVSTASPPIPDYVEGRGCIPPLHQMGLRLL
jgi:hypothetical protein